ncbi:hypothetical protein T265_14314, partial [Opisthorchis viverrini]
FTECNVSQLLAEQDPRTHYERQPKKKISPTHFELVCPNIMILLLEFDAGDPAVVFIARSETEAEIWCQHLVAAQLAPTLQRIGLIRDELRNSTGRDPLDSGPTTIHKVEKPSVTDEGIFLAVSKHNLLTLVLGSSDLKGIEISLSCRDLAWEPESTPNVHIILSLCTPPDSGWKRVGTTEVVEKSSSPTFMKTIYLRSEPLNEKSRLQLELVDLRDMKSELGIRLGVVVTTVSRITEGEALELSVCDASTGLALKSPLNGKTPKVIIQARRCHQPSDATTQSECSITTLSTVCDNLLSKRYLFPHTLGERMHVVEFMGEPRLCFEFPVEYLKALIPREHLLYDSLSRIGSSDPRLESFRKERLITMKQTLGQYEAALRHLVDCSGTKFKPCWERANARYDFVPTNLHVNQVALTDVDGQIVTFHNITSVGAFTTCSRAYKAGGLFRQAADTAHLPSTYPPLRLSASQVALESPIASAACLLETSGVGRANALLYRGAGALAVLRSDLLGLVQRLSARDQAEPLAEKLRKMVVSMQSVFTDGLLNKPRESNAILEDFSTLSKLLSELDVLDKSEGTASPNKSESPASGSVNVAQQRANLIATIDKAGEQLLSCLDKAWDAGSEILWNHVFTGFTGLIRPDPNLEVGWNASSLIAEAERVSTANATVNVDNALTALSVIYDAFNYRHHACLCQALTSVLAALVSIVPHWNRTRWEQVAVCGILTQFEGLLSCYGNELGMIEDWAWAIEHLANIRIVLRPSQPSALGTDPTGSQRTTAVARKNDSYTICAKMTGVHECEVTVPWSSWTVAPNEIQARGRVRIRIHPVSFLVGINEQQSIAEKFDKTAVQQAINNQGYECLKAYFDRYTKHYGAPPRTPSNQDVCDVLANIHHLVDPPVRSKPIEILEYASEITQAFGGIRFTSCKSAKDRTGMSVTLEQIRWLKNAEGMHEGHFQTALQCLRQTGLRVDNVMKNTGGRKYAFNRLQLLYFPRLYRPPVGTYALGVAP